MFFGIAREAQSLEGAVLCPAAHREVLLVCVSVLPLSLHTCQGRGGECSGSVDHVGDGFLC